MGVRDRVRWRSRAELAAVHVGCSGWDYRDWRGALYPQGLHAGRWLECYAQSFDTVEVNTTFYRLVSREAVAHWVRADAAGFSSPSRAAATSRT